MDIAPTAAESIDLGVLRVLLSVLKKSGFPTKWTHFPDYPQSLIPPFGLLGEAVKK